MEGKNEFQAENNHSLISSIRCCHPDEVLLQIHNAAPEGGEDGLGAVVGV